ncbi:diaminopimelate decarboxylase [Paenibacillus uliginis N3/975]|uniref:Diaminopimelate decarboxylase n=1 Tax=Paenibacillus uliginis N3/975 TaxID=1313296 RepID=A0A1X7HJ18_9BACL|nr:diaminopimelate decarboxylase [Paenibacillus uliginis]SMF87564.1 diaminopimelate decarboxylase [Paenibacillus uliginis N3/975]
MFLHGTSRINERGHLEIGGCDTADLKAQFGTPLYIVDEQSVRNRCREYIDAFKVSGLKYQVAYASKAFCVMAMCRLAEEEGMSLDVVSDGELYTALEAGFPAERIHFHGNNKTPDEIEMALDAHIGCFVVDNEVELHLLQAIAAEKGRQVKILLRVTPGVEAHTHEYISTGQTDSKFGFDIGNGSAYEAVKLAASQPNLELLGLHSHIGSQIFEVEGFQMAVQRVAEFTRSVKEGLNVTFSVVNLGGGFGIRYVEGDTPLHVSQYVKAITDAVKTHFAGIAPELPEIWVEPGRSIVGDAGTTLYTVGTSKDIPGVRKYVAVDGGMTDNPRPALYESQYEALLANRANEPVEEKVSIAGKCCESGDMLIWDVELPKVESGDLLAVACTGAYNYSMASNYNRIRKPAVVFVKDGIGDLVVRRESLEDIVRHDVVPVRINKQTVLS